MKRTLCFEPLEFRELLSISTVEIPQPTFEPAESVYVNTSVNTPVNTSGVSELSQSAAVEQNQPFNTQNQNQSATVFVPLSDPVVNLAPPKSARPAYKATPTTLEIYWNSPVATSSLNTSQITGFEIVVRNTTTKEQVGEAIPVNQDKRSILVEGLNVKTRYEILITSCGGAGTSSTKATLKMTATTAAFPAITARASDIKTTSAILTITDRDKVIPFIDGKTTKTYTIEYVEKITSTPDWTNAPSRVIVAGETVQDANKGTIAVKIDNLKPGTQYFFRVQTSYTEGVTDISVDGRHSTFKTAALPATSISKTFFSLDQTNYDFAVGLNGKIASTNKLDSNTTISFSLLVSTATKVVKGTGLLEEAQSIQVDSFTTIDSKGVFSMKPVSLQRIIDA
ncbi:MAG: fibronectin type III domain-containing protein, partial [Planctomycetaceae bacterium]|nr:fibronectin type III domain-containing protein [Planctomycetaceae bacterium]